MIATHPCYDSGNRWPARPHLIVSASRLHAGPRPSRLLSCRKRNIKRRWVRFNFNLKNTSFASASVNLHPDPPFSSEHLRRRGCAWAGYFCSDRSKQTWISVSEKSPIDRWLICFVKRLSFSLSFFLFLSFFFLMVFCVCAWVFLCSRYLANGALGLGPKLGPRLQCDRYGCLVLDLVLRNAQHTCVSGIRRETDYFHEELESLWEKSNFGLSYGQGDDTLR